MKHNPIDRNNKTHWGRTTMKADEQHNNTRFHNKYGEFRIRRVFSCFLVEPLLAPFMLIGYLYGWCMFGVGMGRVAGMKHREWFRK